MEGPVDVPEVNNNKVQSPERAELERFVSYLEDATKVVETWPSWKQEVLAAQLSLGCAAKQPVSSVLSIQVLEFYPGNYLSSFRGWIIY